jgi:hypothetical protein
MSPLENSSTTAPQLFDEMLSTRKRRRSPMNLGIKTDSGTGFGRFKRCGAESGEGVGNHGAPPPFATTLSTSASATVASSIVHSTSTGASTSSGSSSEDKSDYSAVKSRPGKARSMGFGSAQLTLPESARSSSTSGAWRREAAQGKATGSAWRRRGVVPIWIWEK